MEMIDSDNTVVGFDIDFIHAVAKEAGFQVEIKNIAWVELLPGLERGEFDAVISTVTITEIRMKRFDFTVPYVNVGQVLAVSVKMESVTGLADMKGTTVGAAECSIGSSEVTRVSGVELESYNDIDQAFQDMNAGKIQGVVCDYLTAAGYIFGNEEYLNRFRLAGPPFTQQNLGIAVRKGNNYLLERLNKGILSAQSKGIAGKLEEKWFYKRHP